MLSDTHASTLEKLPAKARDLLSSADVIIHAGDYTRSSLLGELQGLGEFKGVFGNMDPPDVRKYLPSVLELEFEGHKIGITHPPEGGAPFGIEARVKRHFSKLDVIIFGHTHMAKKEVIEGTLFVNPGSATGAFPAIHKTMCVVDIRDSVKAEIIKL